MMMEGTRQSSIEGLNRCPFCHESVAASEEEQVACKQCLARHHAACWKEAGGRCSSCAADAVFVAPRASAGASREPVANPVGIDAVRLETARALVDVMGPGKPPGPSPFLDVISLGGWSLGRLMGRAIEHKRANAVELAPLTAPSTNDAEFHRARHAATFVHEQAKPGALPFLFAAMSVFFIGVMIALLVASLSDPTLLLPSYAIQFSLAIISAIMFHASRSELRDHERNQFYVWLVGNGVPPELSRQVFENCDKEWDSRRNIDIAHSLATLVPGLGLFALPIAARRAHGAIALHEAHEAALPLRKKKSMKDEA